MLQLGVYHTLIIDRETSVGLYLRDNSGENEVLLPNKYVPETFEIGDELKVFYYLDHEERPVATTLDPLITLHQFQLLRVAEVNNYGAFLDWGLEKHLFVPFKEQARKMVEGKWYLVYLYIDEKTNRLVGSNRLSKFLSTEEPTFEKFEEVNLIVSGFSDLGVEVIINEKFIGLVYNNEIFEDVKLGERKTGVIKKIREDHKIDVSFQQIGFKNIEPTAQKILDFLSKNRGFMPLHDKSSPEDIEAILGMSKKAFKKGLGSLYKAKTVTLAENGVYLTTPKE